MMLKERTTAMATATPWPRALPRAPFRIAASAGSPRAPMPIEVSVTPICTEEMYSLMFPSCSSARFAPFWPSSRISSSRARRERTSAYSAITKNALIAISTAVRMSLRPFTPARRSPAGRLEPEGGSNREGRAVCGPSGPRYFGEDLRRRSLLADLPTVARAMAGSDAAGPGSGGTVDLARQLKVGVGEPALGVGGERQADLVPAVEEDVGMVVGRLGEL